MHRRRRLLRDSRVSIENSRMIGLFAALKDLLKRGDMIVRPIGKGQKIGERGTDRGAGIRVGRWRKVEVALEGPDEILPAVAIQRVPARVPMLESLGSLVAFWIGVVAEGEREGTDPVHRHHGVGRRLRAPAIRQEPVVHRPREPVETKMGQPRMSRDESGHPGPGPISDRLVVDQNVARGQVAALEDHIPLHPNAIVVRIHRSILVVGQAGQTVGVGHPDHPPAVHPVRPHPTG